MCWYQHLKVTKCLTEFSVKLALPLLPYQKSNIKPAGTVNFMSTTNPEEVFQEPIMDFFLKSAGRNFGMENCEHSLLTFARGTTMNYLARRLRSMSNQSKDA